MSGRNSCGFSKVILFHGKTNTSAMCLIETPFLDNTKPSLNTLLIAVFYVSSIPENRGHK